MKAGRLYWIPPSKGLVQGFIYTLPVTQQRSPSRIICWGEEKWMNLSKAPPQTFRGCIYRLGSHLIGRIPIVETLLWRVHSGIMGESNERVILYTTTASTNDKSQLRSLLNQFLAQRICYHQRWKWINGVLIPPVVLLTILPLVKLVLAWIFFRMIGHARAQSASTWLKDRLSKGILDLQPDPDLDAHLNDKSNNETELFKIYHKLVNKVAIE